MHSSAEPALPEIDLDIRRSMRPAHYIRPLAWLVVAAVVAIKTTDYTIRIARYGLAGGFTGDAFHLSLDISTGLRTVLILAIAVVLLLRARDRLVVTFAALLFALYAGVPALAIVENGLRVLFDRALLAPLFVASVNFSVARYLQL